MNFLEFN